MMTSILCNPNIMYKTHYTSILTLPLYVTGLEFSEDERSSEDEALTDTTCRHTYLDFTDSSCSR